MPLLVTVKKFLRWVGGGGFFFFLKKDGVTLLVNEKNKNELKKWKAFVDTEGSRVPQK